jgi:chromate reductase, NAD(P)H dehydrogenase (quinone)
LWSCSIPKVIAFSGSARAESVNQRLVKIAAEGARASGADVTVLSLSEYPLPLYDADLEALDGLPANAIRLKDLFAGSDGILIATPEYNSSIPALLKNALDWISRPGPGESALTFSAFRGKVAGIMGASPGRLGAVRAVAHLRQILAQLHVLVLAEQAAIPLADRAFAGATLSDAAQNGVIEDIGRRVSHFTSLVRSPQ